MQKIVPCLWFDDNAEEAVNFYTSIFNNSRIGAVTRYTNETPSNKPIGSVLTITFTLEGQEFMALNGGPIFKFTEAISLIVNCETQAEIDDLWAKITAGGGASVQCGWCRDKYGLSWQIVPTALQRMMTSGETEKITRMMEALLEMKKLDLAVLKRAFEGKEAA